MCEPERESERANVGECAGGKGTENDTEREWERTNGRDLRACVLLSKDRAIFQNFTRRA